MKSIFNPKIVYLFFVVFLFSTCKKDEPTKPSQHNVGDSAFDLLNDNPYQILNIEISYMTGFKPQDESIQNLKNFLEKYIHKSQGIIFNLHEIPSENDEVLSLAEINAIENKSRTLQNNGNKMAVHILISDGIYEGNKGNNVVLGIAYKATSICVFGKTIHDNSGGLGKPSRVNLETNVFLHEFSHLLGLVDIGTAMQKNHKDEPHGSHCINKDCLMYYQAESTDIMSMLMSGNIPDLDTDCKNDLKANGGK